MNNQLAPKKIKLHRKSCVLELEFEDSCFNLSCEYLRVFSPSAEVRGHGQEDEILQLNKEDVAITKVEAQGNYAIKLTFSDGHNTGIYTWSYLHELGIKQQQNWSNYLEKVAQHKQQQEQEDTSAVKWVTPKTR